MSERNLSSKAQAQIFKDLLAGVSIDELAQQYRVDKRQIRTIRSNAESLTRVYAPRGWAQETEPRPKGKSWMRLIWTWALSLSPSKKIREVVEVITEPTPPRRVPSRPWFGLSPRNWAIALGAAAGWFVVVAADRPGLQLLGILAGGVLGKIVFEVYARIERLQKEVDQLKESSSKRQE